MKDKKLITYGTGYYRQMSKKSIEKLQPSDLIQATHLPDFYELISAVETSRAPYCLDLKAERKEIVDTHRLKILAPRAITRKDSGYCWAPVFVGDAGRVEWNYSDLIDSDERMLRFLPDKNKKYREAALWNRRRIQTLLHGRCMHVPNMVSEKITENTYWCLFGELIFLSIYGISGLRVSFEDAGSVPDYVRKQQQATTGQFVFLDDNMLHPGRAHERYTYDDLLKIVYIHFEPGDITTDEQSDLYFRTYDNWKANLESYGYYLY